MAEAAYGFCEGLIWRGVNWEPMYVGYCDCAADDRVVAATGIGCARLVCCVREYPAPAVSGYPAAAPG